MFDILAAAALLAAAVVLLVVAVRGVVQMYHNRDRRGGVSHSIAGMLAELDRVVRPSVEHVVEAQELVATREDDVSGD